MGKVARFDSAGASAYAAINLGSDQSEVWVEFAMWSNPEAVNAQAQRILFWADGLYPNPDDAILWAGVGPDPGPGASGPILVEAHFKDDGDYELFHDGVNVQTVSFGPNAGIRTIALPLLFADGGIVYIDDVKIGTTRHGVDLFADDFEDGTLDAWTDVVGAASIVDDTDIDTSQPAIPVTASEGRVMIALTADRLTWDVEEWTCVDFINNLVSGFDISRGRQTENDTTDTSTAVVYLNDRWGYFDPHNLSSTFAGYLGKQILLQVYDPVAIEWVQQTRMWIDHVDFAFNPATRDGTSIVSNVQLHCIDIFGLLSRLQMDVSEDAGNRVFGNTPPAGSEGVVFYEDSSPGDGSGFDDRIIQILDDCGVTSDWRVVFTGNVDLLEGLYDVGDPPLMALQQTVDAEMPGAGNQYSDKQGRYCAHGRGARFDPDGVSAGASPGAWDFRRFKAGDGAAILLDDERAQIRPPLGWSYSEDKVRNVGYSYPKDLDEGNKTGQVYVVPGVDPFDRRVWSAENLLVKAGTTTGNTGAQEAKLYGQFWATVLAQARTRVEALTFKSIALGHPQAEVTWDLMLNADISDIIDLEHGYAGGEGISEDFFIEGSEMIVRRLNPTMDSVTVTFNVSPQAYYADSMGLLGNIDNPDFVQGATLVEMTAWGDGDTISGTNVGMTTEDADELAQYTSYNPSATDVPSLWFKFHNTSGSSGYLTINALTGDSGFDPDGPSCDIYAPEAAEVSTFADLALGTSVGSADFSASPTTFTVGVNSDEWVYVAVTNWQWVDDEEGAFSFDWAFTQTP